MRMYMDQNMDPNDPEFIRRMKLMQMGQPLQQVPPLQQPPPMQQVPTQSRNPVGQPTPPASGDDDSSLGSQMGAGALKGFAAGLNTPPMQLDPNLGRSGTIFPRQAPSLFMGGMARGGRLRPGQSAQVGKERVRVNQDGTATIDPPQDPEDYLTQYQDEQRANPYASVGLGRSLQNPINKAPQLVAQDDSTGAPEVKTMDPKVNGFTADHALPGSMPTNQLPNPTAVGQQVQSAPPLPTGTNTVADPYDTARAQYIKDITPGKAPGKGSQVLFQLFQGMSNFSRGMQGQQMQAPVSLSDARYQNQIEGAKRKFAPQLQAHEMDVEQRRAELDARLKGAEVNGKLLDNTDKGFKASQSALDLLRAQNPMLAKQAEHEIANGKLTPETQAALQQAGYGQSTAADTREMEDVVNNGVHMQRPKGSTEDYKPVDSLQPEATKVPQWVRREDGSVVPVTGPELISADAVASANKAKAALDQGKLTADEYSSYTKQLSEWDRRESERKNQASGWNADAGAAESQMAAKKAELEQLKQERDDYGDPVIGTKEGRTRQQKLTDEINELSGKAQSLREKAKSLKGEKRPVFHQTTLPTNNYQAPQVVKPTTARMDDVRAYAAEKGIDESEALKRFKAAGKTIIP